MMKRIRAALAALLASLLLVLVLALPVQADFGTNWTGTFFPSTDLTGTGVPVAGINGINFNWGGGPPVVNGVAVPGIPSDNFTARFTSTQALTPGTYNFVVSSDDGVRVFINGALVLDRFVGRPLTTDQFTFTVTTSPVNFTVEYLELVDQAVVQFQYFLQSGQPTTAFGTPGFGTTLTPFVTAPPGLTVEVSGVRGLAIRTGPYLGASLVGVLRPGTAYVPTARNRDEGVYTWFLINTGERQGWVSSRYLNVVGNVELAPNQSTVFEQLDGPAETGVTGTTRSVMNLRRRPTERAALLAQIPWGAEVPIFNRTIQGGRNFWLQVRYEDQIGWIFAPFVTINGEIQRVPTR